MFYERMQSELSQINSRISHLQNELNQFPPGKLIGVKNGNYIKWFNSNGHSCTYIPKRQKALAINLAKKKYIQSQIEDLNAEKNAIEHCSEVCKCKANNTSYLESNHEFMDLIYSYQDHPLSYSDEISEWAKSPYDQSSKHPESLKFKCPGGGYVRSKSELIIALMLSEYKIPFRYECPLVLRDVTFYPDFTTRHPHTGEYIYFEHFGLMDDSVYCSNAFQKLGIYSSYNIIPGKNLITTFESNDAALDPEFIRTLIEYYYR